jgi:hypothetical protein
MKYRIHYKRFVLGSWEKYDMDLDKIIIYNNFCSFFFHCEKVVITKTIQSSECLSFIILFKSLRYLFELFFSFFWRFSTSLEVYHLCDADRLSCVWSLVVGFLNTALLFLLHFFQFITSEDGFTFCSFFNRIWI